MNAPTHAPTKAHIAQQLAALVYLLPGYDNSDRARLRSIAELLSGGPVPNVEAAAAEAAQGVSHSIRPDYTEQRPETWLLCAVGDLLRKPAQGRVKLPSSDDLAAWLDMLEAIGQELTEPDAQPAPVRDTSAAVMRACQVQMLRLWLVGALHIRAFADLGQDVGDDPDALPIGGAPAPQ